MAGDEIVRKAANRRYRFDDVELDVQNLRLTVAAEIRSLEPKSFRLLMFLIENRGRTVPKEVIMAAVWPDTFVTDNALTRAIVQIRKALIDDAKEPKYIQTVPSVGYRFVADCKEVIKEQDEEKSLRVVGPLKRVMLAVLPFENLSADPEQDYFSDGLTEETISYLGRVNPRAMGLIARTSSMAYKRTHKSIGQIGSELGVDFILESSVRREGDRMRITSQLIQVKDQTHLWASSFDSDASGFLGVQRELGTAIAEQVRITLMPQLGGFAHSRFNMDAYDLYLQGRYYWNQLTPPGIRRGIACFEQVVSMEPDNALAWAGMADCYSMLPIIGDEPGNEILPKALAAAQRSVELGGDLAEAHSSLGTVKVWMEWDWPGAEAEFRRALELNPSYVQAHRYYAHLLSQTGRHAEAAVLMDVARSLDPLSPIMHALSGHLRWHARDYRGAMTHLREAEAISANLWIVHTFLGRVYECTGRWEESLREYQKAFDLSGGGSTEPIAFRARVQALTGDRAAAEQALHTLLALSERKFVPPYNIAIIYAGLGDTENTLHWLEKGFELRDVRLVFLLVDPRWDGIRQEPRFQNLSRRLNLLSALL
jgi:TolB-like protein/tetratricopeptide (TPR) repeat protein